MHLADYHLHTNHSFDSTQTLMDVCNKAVEMSLKEIAITDHFSVIEGRGSYGFMNKEKYLKDIELHKDLFKDKLIIKKGLEICEPHLNEDDIEKLYEIMG